MAAEAEATTLPPEEEVEPPIPEREVPADAEREIKLVPLLAINEDVEAEEADGPRTTAADAGGGRG